MQPADKEKEAVPWQGTARYEVIKCLGRGGMGVVYEAFDRDRGRRVAIKTLLNFSPRALYLFKQEFRTLSNVLHPNLVQLHELVASETDGVFFTMELVHGQDFHAYTQRPEIRAANRLPPATTEGRPLLDTPPRPSGTLPVDRTSSPDLEPAKSELAPTPANLDRLRDALRQLAEGTYALHSAGKVHRDIKPSNVLVAENGRVVLLDFGVATELSRVIDERLSESHRVGTPEYMAPEQALGDTVTAASDWYSVGALLYEALVGKPPFVGDATDVLYRKAVLDPPAPREVVDGVPDDLNALCCDLLQRRPENRMTGRKVLQALGSAQSNLPSPPPAATSDISRSRLIGRSAELLALHDAFDTTRAGNPVIVRVTGPSGVGKTALVNHFVDDLIGRGEAVALRGRAYERESVAYKAVDGVVDALSRYLSAIEHRGETFPLLPEAWALACLFPVLRRVEAIAALPAGSLDDPQQVRQLAFVALRELLSQLVRLHPMIVHIDDVQWGESDSATLLWEVMRPPLAPPLLLILGCQDDAESDKSPFLEELFGHELDGVDVRNVAVKALALEDARRLALGILGNSSESAQRVADAIARGARGSAFFVEDLARNVQAQGLAPDTDTFIDAVATLGQLIEKRVDDLDHDPRRILELIAIHGRPVASSILRDSARVTDDLDPLINELRSRHFVHLVARGGREMVETTHDQIRDVVVGRLSAEGERGLHRRLAVAYEAQTLVDAEAVVVHWVGAGEPQRAVTYSERAAEQASGKLAFDRTVSLYELTLSSLPPDSEDALRVREKLAEALGWAGRGAESAHQYLEAARLAPDDRRPSLERAGANQLLLCGQIEEGTRILRVTLDRLGRGAPKSAYSALLWLIVYSVWLRIVGLRFVGRDSSAVPKAHREYLAALYSAATGLVLVDVIVGNSLLARLIATSLRMGSRDDVGTAAVLGANQLAARGGPEGRREQAMVRLGDELAERLSIQQRPTQALYAMRAVRLFLRGHWKAAHETFDKAYTLPAAREGWNAHAVAVFDEIALSYLGETGELARRLPNLLADAERRGDLLKITNLRTAIAPIVFMARDDPAAARRHVLEAIANWSQRGFMLQHWRAMIAEVDIDLYDGQGARAYERLAREARAFRRSMLSGAQYVRAVTSFARARACVSAAVEMADLRAHHLRKARRLAQRLEREKMPWISTLSSLVAASVANAEGDVSAAQAHLCAAAERADATDMTLHACAARHRLGSLLGGDESRGLVMRAESTMQHKGIRAPARYVAVLLPGRWAVSSDHRPPRDER